MSENVLFNRSTLVWMIFLKVWLRRWPPGLLGDRGPAEEMDWHGPWSSKGLRNRVEVISGSSAGTENPSKWKRTQSTMGFSYTFIHTDINQRIPENWALRELYWKHSEIKGDVLENPKNKVWSSFTFECRKIPIMDKRAYGPQLMQNTDTIVMTYIFRKVLKEVFNV